LQALIELFSRNLDFVFFVAVFGGVALIIFSIAIVWRDRAEAKRRLTGEAGRGERDEEEYVSLNAAHENFGSVGRALKSVEHVILPTDTSELTEARKKMLRAGYSSSNALRVYYFLRIALGISLPLLILFFSSELSRTMEWRNIGLLAAVMGLIGMFSPTAWISSQTSKRQEACRDGFPDALDMLLVSVEAGLGLDAAVNRVAAELGTAHPILAEHFQNVGAQLRAGRSRENALRNMADQIGIEEVGSLVTMLIQSEMLGTSIAQALRVHADDMRIKRMMRAEEMAHMLPVKMTVPLILGILPPLVLVILAPAIINFMRVKGGG
jgi:tight adherence protein C